MRNIGRYLISLIDNPITKGLAFSLWTIPLYYYLNSYVFNVTLSSDDYNNIRQFIEWLGIPYGMLMALMLINVWTQFDTVGRAFDREADSILAFYNSIILVPNPKIKRALKTNIYHYIEHVKANFSTEFADVRLKREGNKILNEILELIVASTKAKSGGSLSLELLRLHNDWVTDRGERLSFSSQRMPTPVMMLYFIASFLWLAPFFILKFSSPFIGMFFIGGVTLLIISIGLIMNDLDKPFEGAWGVNLDAWDELLVKKIDDLQ